MASPEAYKGLWRGSMGTWRVLGRLKGFEGALKVLGGLYGFVWGPQRHLMTIDGPPKTVGAPQGPSIGPQRPLGIPNDHHWSLRDFWGTPMTIDGSPLTIGTP